MKRNEKKNYQNHIDQEAQITELLTTITNFPTFAVVTFRAGGSPMLE